MQDKYFINRCGTKGGLTVSRTAEDAAAMSTKNPAAHNVASGQREVRVSGSYEKFLALRRNQRIRRTRKATSIKIINGEKVVVYND